MTGKITLAFFSVAPDGVVTQLRSKRIEYPSIEVARAEAVRALEMFPHITYASIDFQPTSGSIRSIEKVQLGPVV